MQHRSASYDRRYLVGFVRPASGRTVFALAATVSIPVFEVALEAFVRRVGASNQADRPRARPGRLGMPARGCAWLRVPEQVHLLFLPADSPELLLAEHLWPLSNTARTNCHCATIEDPEDVHAACCVALQARPDRIR